VARIGKLVERGQQFDKPRLSIRLCIFTKFIIIVIILLLEFNRRKYLCATYGFLRNRGQCVLRDYINFHVDHIIARQVIQTAVLSTDIIEYFYQEQRHCYHV